MTKVLRCGDLMPGCSFVARADDEGELMRKVVQHAKDAHGMQTVPPEVAEKARSAIRDE